MSDLSLKPNNGVRVRDIQKLQYKSIRCPHCQKIGTFEPLLPKFITFSVDPETEDDPYLACEAIILGCPSIDCQGVVFAVSTQKGNEREIITTFPPETIDFEIEGIPPTLVMTLREAIVCHSNGAHRASAMMVRRLLEELCEECGAQGDNLFKRLRNLREKITLPEELFDSMDELKALGNDAAHIEAREYKSIDADEAETSIMLAKEILKARYQHRLLLDRLRRLKK